MNSVFDSSKSTSGPFVWGAIVVVTCILLFLFQKVLWLVVPFMLALVLYYLLIGPVKYLVLRGMSRNSASTTVMLFSMLVFAGCLLLVLPRISRHLFDWQEQITRYLNGGLHLLDVTLISLEEYSSLLARAHLSAKVRIYTQDFMSSFADEHVAPLLVGLVAWMPVMILTPFLTFSFLKEGRAFKHFLSAAVPNAFFERTLYLLNEVDQTTRSYFNGLMKLTLLDTLTLAIGLAILGMPAPIALGFAAAVLAWIPYVGSIIGGLLVVLVAATDFSDAPAMAYAAIALFIFVRLLDDFLYMPMTIGRSMKINSFVTVMMIFIGGAVAGIAGLMLVFPLLGVVMVVSKTIGQIITDPRLMARHRYSLELKRRQASVDLL